MIAARHRNFRNPNQRGMSDRSFHLEEMEELLSVYIYIHERYRGARKTTGARARHGVNS